jgi:lysophospholipase L1-like esterase
LKRGGSALCGLVVLMAMVLPPACSKPRPGTIILCAGDSLTAQAYPRHLGRIARAAGLRTRVLNYGRSGFTSGEYLRFLRNKNGAIAAERPDAILLLLGTNDVRVDGDRTSTPDFEKNMNAILDIFQDFRARSGRAPVILVASVPPVSEDSGFPFSAESSRRVREEINPLLKRIAEKRAIPLVDHYSLFVRSPRLLPGIHPSEEGYREMAANWFRALKPYLPRD